MNAAAIYTRYSSDNQRHESVEDQARNCRRWAERQGVDIRTLYADEAISGSRSDRPEYQRMLTDAKAGAFSFLLLDDLSRLSRDQVETEQTIRRLEHWGIRIVALDGYDSELRGRKVQRAVKGLMNELYLDDLRDKTHRGLEGQAGRGFWAGGKPYGYKLRAITDPAKLDAHGQPVRIGTRLELDEAMAAVVVRIYKRFSAGASCRTIADELNADGVTAPGAAWKRTRRDDAKPRWLASAIYGSPKLGAGILRNDLYRGVAVWNRSRWVRDPDTRKRVYQLRPESEHVVRELPELRIVPDALWRQVQARLAETRAASTAVRKALHTNARTGRTPKYLLSGLLVCGECGASLIMNGSGKSQSYGCSTRINGGTSACSNTVRIPRTIAETRLVAGLKRELATPEFSEAFSRSVRKLLAAKHADAKGAGKRRRDRLAELEQEIPRLVDAIAAGLLSPAVKSRLQAAEAERNTLARQDGEPAHATAKVVEMVPRMADSFYRLVADLETSALADVAAARRSLKRLVGTVRVQRADDGAPVGVVNMETARFLGEAGPLVSMVAGASFGCFRSG